MRIALLLTLLFALARPARGEDAQGARQHYDQGTTLYDLGRYRDAAREYEEAFRLKPEPALLFNIAQAYRLGGDYAEALRSYRSYLRRQPQAGNRAEVAAHIVKLEKLVEQQKQASASPPTGTIPPEPKVTAPPEPPRASPAIASPAVTLKAEPQTVSLRSSAPGPTPVYKRWWPWTILGVAVAAGVGLGVGLSLGLQQDVEIPAGARTVQFP